MTLSEFLETQIKIYGIRNGDRLNPIVSTFVVEENIYKVVMSKLEPSFVGLPVNVIWISVDSEKPAMYGRAFRRTSKTSDSVKGTRNTWTEISDYNDLFSENQVYDLGGGFLLGELSTGVSIPKATTDVSGLVRLTAKPTNFNEPTAIGNNDDRMTDARTPTSHTHVAQAVEQLKSFGGALNLNQSPAPVAGQVLVIDANGNGLWRNLKQSDIYIPPTVLNSIAITSGPATVLESDTNISYVCTAYYANNTSQIVTPVWTSSDTNVLTISPTGIITINSLSANATATITATYTFAGVTKTATKTITITNINFMSTLAVSGPSIINEGATGDYVATATYDNGTTSTVPATWTITNVPAGQNVTINSSTGKVTVTNVTSTFNARVTATYTQAGITKSNYMDVQVTDMAVTLTSIAIVGDGNVYESTTRGFSITANYSNGTSVPKAGNSTGLSWSLAVGTYATISSSGVVSALAVTSDQPDTLNATYTEGGVTKTATLALSIKDNYPVSLAVSGIQTVNEKTSNSYVATATMANNTTQVVTLTSTWTATGGTLANNVWTAPDVSASTVYTITATYTSGTYTVTGNLAITVNNVTTFPKIYYGTGPFGINTESAIMALTAATSTASGQTFDFSVVGNNVYGYFAIPSTVVNAGAATFTQLSWNALTSKWEPTSVGGWDGASWPQGDFSDVTGPIQVAGTHEGSAITWYLYRTDWDAVGALKVLITW